MTALHEAAVGARFDLLHRRFKREVGGDDVRLRAIVECLAPIAGLRILDLGCGKGRFAARLARAGAEVIGLDLSAAMLAEAQGFARARGSAGRLPFADGTFDAVIAVEVFEHLAAIDEALLEIKRVLRTGGKVAIIDKNAASLNDRRPWLPSLAVKWRDERRGLWMYPARGTVRERWFWPGRFCARLRRSFDDVRVAYLLTPKESMHAVFRIAPRVRLLAMWSARVPGGSH